MPILFQKFQAALKNRTTYRVGLLQAKAYRALKQSTSIALERFNISTVDWALLGMLYDHKIGKGQSEIADELGVERPFITILTKNLVKKGYVKIKESKEDSRVKFTQITSKGINFVEKIEKDLRSETRYILNGVSISDISTYIYVLEKIIENSLESH